MLKRAILFTYMVFFLTVGLSGSAYAKKGIVLFNFNAETIVKVVDLPDIPPLQSEDGRYIDLGYKFNPTGGDWVGYIGSDDKYIRLDPKTLQAMLAIAGLKKAPPVPDRPAGSKLHVFLFLIGIGMVAFFALLCLIFLLTKAVKHFRRPKPVGNPFAELYEDIRKRAEQSGRTLPKPTSFGATRPAAEAAKTSFGKRPD